MTLIHPVALPVPAEASALTGRDKVQALGRRARQALDCSARFGGLSLGALEKNDDGAPLPSNGIHWSLTHKERWVAAVAAPFAVGIDLEKIGPVNPGLYRRVAGAEEWDLIGPPDPNRFFRLWTAKEAVLKAEGRGIGGLGHCKVDTVVDGVTLRLAYDGTLWTVSHHWFAGDHLIAVTAGQADLVWHILSKYPERI